MQRANKQEQTAKQQKIPAWLSGSVVLGMFGLLWVLERRRPRIASPKKSS